MKKILLLFILFSICTYAQTEYVLANNPVYNFLERMETLHLINRYNSFEIPKTRNEIAGYLKEVIERKDQLDEVDKKILHDLEAEFELEIYGTLKRSESLIGENRFNFLSQGEKYLYYIKDTTRNINMFFNSTGQAQAILGNYLENTRQVSAGVLSFQFQVRGSIFDKFGFFWRGGDGVVVGNREAALFREDLQFNYHYNTFDKPNSFDITTAGYMTGDFGPIKLKFGRDRKEIGYGPIKTVLGPYSQIFDNLSIRVNYKAVEFSYFHGKLLGNSSYSYDPVHGSQNIITEKYIGYHRLGFNISNDFNIGGGELIIYGDRPLDLTYLNPFNLYKTAQNSNKDRDNSMIIFDFNNKSIKGLKLYGTFLIDDIELSKVGSNYWGDIFMYNFGLLSENFYKYAPVDFQFEYVRMDPYVFSHRLPRNSYTNNGYSLGSFMQPNSELFFTQINYRFTNRLKLSAMFNYYIHGANPLNPDGTVKRNVGGDVLLGHREFDSKDAPFLDGDKEYTRKLSAKITYEPLKDVFFSGRLVYLNQSLQNSVNKKRFETYVTFEYKL